MLWRIFKTQIITLFFCAPKSHIYLIMQITFCSSSSILKVLMVPAVVKTKIPKSPLRLKENSQLWVPKKKKGKLNSFSTKGCRISVPTLRGRNRCVERKDWTNVRLEHVRVNIKFYSSDLSLVTCSMMYTKSTCLATTSL
jgi:hypothetical protein